MRERIWAFLIRSKVISELTFYLGPFTPRRLMMIRHIERCRGPHGEDPPWLTDDIKREYKL